MTILQSFATAALLAMTTVPPTMAATGESVASKEDVVALQAQLEQLSQRLDRLESVNAQLRAENATLDALAARRADEIAGLETEVTELRARPASVAAAGADEHDSAAWVSRIKVRGDLRYRHEHLESERDVDGSVEDAADRDRQRIRARLAVDARVTDSITTTLALSTGGEDPRGSNETLGNASSRKQIDLDLAYADWRFTEDAHFVLGKQPYPVWRPINSLFLDSDVNPEGGAVRFARGAVFASAYGYWLTEQYSSDPAGPNTDAGIVGLQAGIKLGAVGGETTLAAHYYSCGACKDHSPLYANNANGNTTYQVGTVNVLQYGYDILDLSAQVGSTVGAWPIVLTAGYARNFADDVEHDTAYAVAGYLGRLGDAGSWEAGLLYQSVDKDALFGQIADSDFGNGLTDSRGWVLKAGYVPVKNVALNTQLYLNTINKDVGTELDVARLQLDVNYRF